MKKILLMATMLATLTACDHYEFTEETTNDKGEIVASKAFTFHLKGDFTTSFEEMTRAAVRLENDNTAGITDIWVLDYQDGKLLQQVHQVASDADFGHPNMKLTYGEHNIKFVASKGVNPTLTASALTWAKVLDTFVLDYPVYVVASSNGNRAPELKRAIGGVKIVATDVVKNGTQKVSVTMKRSLSLALPALAPNEATASANEFSITSSQWDKTGLSLTTYTLCDEELTTDVVVTVTGDDNALISQFTVSDVSVKKNRITTLTGDVFGRGNGFSVAIDDSWDEGLDVNF